MQFLYAFEENPVVGGASEAASEGYFNGEVSILLPNSLQYPRRFVAWLTCNGNRVIKFFNHVENPVVAGANQATKVQF